MFLLKATTFLFIVKTFILTKQIKCGYFSKLSATYYVTVIPSFCCRKVQQTLYSRPLGGHCDPPPISILPRCWTVASAVGSAGGTSGIAWGDPHPREWPTQEYKDLAVWAQLRTTQKEYSSRGVFCLQCSSASPSAQSCFLLPLPSTLVETRGLHSYVSCRLCLRIFFPGTQTVTSSFKRKRKNA